MATIRTAQVLDLTLRTIHATRSLSPFHHIDFISQSESFVALTPLGSRGVRKNNTDPKHKRNGPFKNRPCI